jgi:hypothetical protein
MKQNKTHFRANIFSIINKELLYGIIYEIKNLLFFLFILVYFKNYYDQIIYNLLEKCFFFSKCLLQMSEKKLSQNLLIF